MTRLRLVALLALPLLSGCSTISGWFGDDEPPLPPGLEVPAELQLPYTVTLRAPQGELDSDLADVLEASSQLFTLIDEPPPGLPGLQRRADGDVERLAKALRSEGYYDATVRIDVAQAPPPEGQPAPVEIIVDPGARYTFGVIGLRPVGEVPPGIDVTEFDIKPGDPARGPGVDAARRALVREMAERGYPFASSTMADGDFVLDREAKTLSVTLPLESGQQATLGELQVEGLERVPAEFVQNRVPWERGELYTPERVEALRRALAARDLFASVNVDVADKPAPDGSVPVTVDVTEKPPRFLSLGGGYGTSEGAYLSAEWGHRNLFGGAERFNIEGRVGGLGAQGERTDDGTAVGAFDYELNSTLDIPDFWVPDQNLIFDALAELEHPEAYERRALTLGARLERVVTEGLTLGAGVVVERATIQRPLEPREDYNLVGLPLIMRRDTSDDVLDPTEGSRIRLTVTPYAGFGGDGGSFLLARADAATYWALDDDARYVLAGRAAAGAIIGGREQIPADKRFYSGGGGSVRGYGFQRIGPLDARNNPRGGRSLLELGGEARIRIGESWGVVPFVDAGAVSDESYPGGGTDLRVGAGLGVRYYTGFGPIRADLAIPFNRRSDDDAFQVYISLGQAF